MTVKDILDNCIGRVRIMSEKDGRSLADFDSHNPLPEVVNQYMNSEVCYMSAGLRYFCNSKKAEYSSALNIFI